MKNIQPRGLWLYLGCEMIKLLAIAAHLADSLHYLSGVRFDMLDIDNNQNYQKALELSQKAHTDLLKVIDDNDGWISIDAKLPPRPDEYLVYYGDRKQRQRQTVYLPIHQFDDKEYLQAVGITHWAYLMANPNEFTDDDMPF